MDLLGILPVRGVTVSSAGGARDEGVRVAACRLVGVVWTTARGLVLLLGVRTMSSLSCAARVRLEGEEAGRRGTLKAKASFLPSTFFPPYFNS